MREMLAKISRFLIPFLLIPAVAGIVLAILAPLGTSHFSLLERLGYWIGLCLAGALGAGATQYGLSRLGQRPNRWPLAVMESFGATLAVSLFILRFHETSNFTATLLSLFYIWVIAMAICAVGALQTGHAAPEADHLRPDATPPLVLRLKPALRRAEIYALEAQDHYVRVITSAGEDLLLMRISDAIAETAPLPGLSPHRSWWVAEAAVSEVVRRHGKAIIQLKNSAEIPVSRGRLKTLRAQAWL